MSNTIRVSLCFANVPTSLLSCPDITLEVSSTQQMRGGADESRCDCFMEEHKLQGKQATLKKTANSHLKDFLGKLGF